MQPRLSPDTCSRWPACGCFDCEDAYPRSRWAGPIIILSSLAAWALFVAGFQLAFSLTLGFFGD